MEKTKADIVLELLNGRKGFDDWWDNLDGEIQSEIRDALNVALDKAQ